MVQIIENWAVINGTIVDVASVENDPDHRDLTVEIETIENYGSYPNLLVQKPADKVTVRLKSSQLGAAPIGKRVSIRVKRKTKADKLFAYPDWSMADK